MFTGIVTETARIEKLVSAPRGRRLILHREKIRPALRTGDSLAVNGCCLTVAGLDRGKRGQHLAFDLSEETWARTSFRAASPRGMVNLEHCLPAHGRLGGHFVLGHIDGVGSIRHWRRTGDNRVLEVAVPPDLRRYLVVKGSIALDGISLTLSAVSSRGFEVWIVPYTFEHTALRERNEADLVNLEVDILGKYVERFLKGSARVLARARQ